MKPHPTELIVHDTMLPEQSYLDNVKVNARARHFIRPGSPNLHIFFTIFSHFLYDAVLY
jgi:hypothetical protein